jgi:flotillin
VLPEIAAAISEPLSRAGATTIISNGNGHEGTGAAKLSQDVVQVLSQLSPIMEQLAGVDLKRFLQDVSKIPGAVASKGSGEGLVRVESAPPVQPPRAS